MARAGVMFVVVICHGLNSATGADDPCLTARLEKDDGGRSTKCSLYYKQSDRFIIEGWRRIQLETTGENLTMPIYCVATSSCGTHYPIWLNGSYPTVEDGVVDRVGCLSTPSSCCYTEYPIQVQNCTYFMVYYFLKTFGSDERYCFGNSTQCFKTTTTTTSTTLPIPTTTTTTSTTPVPTTTTTTTLSTGSTAKMTIEDAYSIGSGEQFRRKIGHQRNAHGADQLTYATIGLVVVVALLIVVGVLLYMKYKQRLIMKVNNASDIYGAFVDEKPPLKA